MSYLRYISTLIKLKRNINTISNMTKFNTIAKFKQNSKKTHKYHIHTCFIVTV